MIDADKLVTLDFETYWAKDFSLSSMPTSVYVRSPLFKIHCVGIKQGTQPTEVFFYDDVEEALRSIDWDSRLLLCHNTAFDGFILADRFDIAPHRYLDTLSMARGALGVGVKHGLDHLSVRFGLLPKLSATLESTKGVERYTPEMIESVRRYCARDVDNTFYLFLKLMMLKFPPAELDLIDTTLRMYCRPLIRCDRALVQEELDFQLTTKFEMLERSGVSRQDLLSNDKFAGLLDKMGVEPPEKVSARTGKMTWAFAKNDPDFLALLDHEDEEVRQLVEARLIVKSTIGETRAKRLLDVSENDRPVPVMLKYCGAHTTRWSAGDRMNFQNFPKGGRLRYSLMAPPGHVLVVCDSAQIEARVNAWLAGQTDVLAKFAAGEDVYKYMASQIFGIPAADIDKTQRFLGKVCVLALGYGMGAEKFQKTLKTAKPTPMTISMEEASRITNGYRGAMKAIVDQWRNLERAAARMIDKNASPTHFKCLTFMHEKIVLPNGLAMIYDDIGYDDDGQLRYKTLSGWVKLYGGLITENIVQGLARVVVADQMSTIAKRYPVVLMTHDEIVACAPAAEGQEALDFMLATMRTPPTWAPGLPVNAEGEFYERYRKS